MGGGFGNPGRRASGIWKGVERWVPALSPDPNIRCSAEAWDVWRPHWAGVADKSAGRE